MNSEADELAADEDDVRGRGPDEPQQRYVHRPDGPATPTESEELDRRGWILVGVLVLCVLVVPGIIYLFPAAPTRTGLPFFAAMLALPLVPAVLLGLTAVWSMTTTGGDDPKAE